MKTYFARQFADLCNFMIQLRLVELGTTVSDQGAVSSDGKNDLINSIRAILRDADYLGLQMTFKGAERFLTDLEAVLAGNALEARIDELERRFEDEIAGKFFLYLSDDEIPFFKGERVSPKIRDKFPRAGGEMTEAGKCYALGMHTACVFHLMRTLEIALKVIARSLTIPDPTRSGERNWGHMLRAIDSDIKQKNQAMPVGWAEKKNFYENAYALLEAVKNPWRNASMHVELNYDQEKALDIVNASDALMRHLSEQLSE
jgi:hypothetical protein